MLVLETARVSRKTPGDGKLELHPESARRLREAGASLTVTIGEAAAPGLVVTMPCTCAKAGRSGTHEHQFLEAEPLRSLTPEQLVEVALDAAAAPPRVYIRPV